MPLSHNPSRTTIHLRALAVAALAGLAACGDSSLTTSRQRSLPADRPVLDKMLSSTTVTYTPWDGLYASLGSGNALYIPSGGVCDPATSSYGAGKWDQACSTASKPITITVQNWLDDKGHPYVQFQPALRFVPNKYVVLYIADNKAVLDGTARIVYCPDEASCIDEAKTDLSLFTLHWSGGVYRRIKHFSGYNVAAGLDDIREFSRSSIKGLELQLNAERSKRSGYMVVSGVEDLPKDAPGVPKDAPQDPQR